MGRGRLAACASAVIVVVLAIVGDRCVSLFSAGYAPKRVPSQDVATEAISLSRNCFGEVWASSDFEHRVLLRNESDRVIEIHQLAASCLCTQIKPAKLALGPGGSAEVRATLNLTSRVFGRRAVRISPLIYRV